MTNRQTDTDPRYIFSKRPHLYTLCMSCSLEKVLEFTSFVLLAPFLFVLHSLFVLLAPFLFVLHSSFVLFSPFLFIISHMSYSNDDDLFCHSVSVMYLCVCVCVCLGIGCVLYCNFSIRDSVYTANSRCNAIWFAQWCEILPANWLWLRTYL